LSAVVSPLDRAVTTTAGADSPDWYCLTILKTFTDSAPPGRKDVVSFFSAFSNLLELEAAEPARNSTTTSTIHLPRGRDG